MTGEHGIEITKTRYIILGHDPVSLRVVRASKKALDTHKILNPSQDGLWGLNNGQ
jgi:FAD/FMN-containing dehydrogenase